MGRPLRVLIVEDEVRDAELVLRELRRGNFDVQFERVETAEGMSAALDKQQWDVVLSDYGMPRFGAPEALALLKRRKLDLPFIIVSGTVGEEVAVAALRAGAHDFMAKGKLARLLPAIDRELQDASRRAERAQMQEQLRIAERMASVGTLAAGVAHEINNPLAAAIANLQFAADDVAALGRDIHASTEVVLDAGAGEWLARRLAALAEPLRDAQECAERIRVIVSDLKVFSRGDEAKGGAVDVARVLESSIRMAWNEVRHRARLVRAYGEVPPVHGNEGRLGQVFLNLIVNAAQAMPEGRADQNEIRISTRREAADWVMVEVQDTGAGIPGAVLSRIFDPFFTTKAVGLGTGLGLAICHRIVTALGGQMRVESEVGRGTLVRTLLPISMESLPDAAAVRTDGVVPCRRGRVLVVDDEAMLGGVVCRMLSAQHVVVAVTSAREALARIEQGELFDVILCDLMMPEVTGMELHDELLRVAPQHAARMVFMTGGAFTSRAQEFIDQVPNARIEKPFDIDELSAVIQSQLR